MSGDFAEWVAGMGTAAANHLWQSTACVAGAWLLTLALRANQARVRHAVWVSASIKFLVPFSLLIGAGNLLPHPKQAVAPVVYSAIDVVEEPFAETGLHFATPAVHVATMRERVEAEMPAGLFALWGMGASVVLLVWAMRWRVVRRILREAEAVTDGREWEILRRVEGANLKTKANAGVPRLRDPLTRLASLGMTAAGRSVARHQPEIELRLSAERMEPGIFGVWRPVLVWPRELSARLDDEHIEAILAHELAHVRRRDNLTALVHMVVEAAFWFHPLVWWIEGQMVKEREQACDEAVVMMGGDSSSPPVSLCDTDGAPALSGTIPTSQNRDVEHPAGSTLDVVRSLPGENSTNPGVPFHGTDGASGDCSTPGGEIAAQSYAEVYAEALLKTCRFCVESPLSCVSGVTGADLKRRVAGIVTGRALLRMTWPKKALVTAAAVGVVIAPVMLGQAKAAQRVMQAAMKVASTPLHIAATHPVIAEEQTPSRGEIAEVQGPALPAQVAAAETRAQGDITGTWQGTAALGQMNLRWVLKIAKKADGSWGATFYNIDQNATPTTATNVSFSGGTLKYAIPQMGSSYEGRLSADGNALEGEIALGPRTVPLTYVRATKETAWAIPDPPAPRKAMAADADPDFEVATIKPNNSGGGAMQGVASQGREFNMRNASLADMIAFAYGVQKKQIVNAPDWLDKDRYDITAASEPEGQPSPAQLKTMMRKLLAQRFKLAVHDDKREMSAYVLSVDKGGNKLAASQSKGSGPSIRIQPAKGGMGLMVGNATMDEFAGFLQTPVLDRPVVNHTGIEGRYDIAVTFTPDSSEFGGRIPPPPADGSEAAPDLFQAVQQQLGLKLVSEKTTVDMIAIDHAEKPGEN